MRIPERGEKGFTLIELLIVVAILGVLAAVVIPNVGRFIGSGREEAAATELSTIQTAVSAMMVDNQLTLLELTSSTIAGTGNMSAVSAATATWDMSMFPANGASSNGTSLWHYAGNSGISYVQTQNTTGTYYVDSTGTVTQAATSH